MIELPIKPCRKQPELRTKIPIALKNPGNKNRFGFLVILTMIEETAAGAQNRGKTETGSRSALPDLVLLIPIVDGNMFEKAGSIQ